MNDIELKTVKRDSCASCIFAVKDSEGNPTSCEISKGTENWECWDHINATPLFFVLVHKVTGEVIDPIELRKSL